MNTTTFRALLVGAQILFMALWAGGALADEHSGSIVAGGIMIYYGIVPAEMLQGYGSGHPESAMHGGVPGGKHVHHVMVALFDAESLERIEDAKVTATLTEIGLAGKTKALEPMTVAGALTYGNYFKMKTKTLYWVVVNIERPGAKRHVKIKIEYNHR